MDLLLFSQNKVNIIFLWFFGSSARSVNIQKQPKQVLSKSLVHQFAATSAKLGPEIVLLYFS